MEYKINSGIWGSMFGVPCIIADNLLKFADGNNLKVLLYLLRNSGTAVKTEEISANTGVPEQQIEEAVIFWEQFNIFSLEDSVNQAKPVNNIMTAPPQSAPAAKTAAEEKKNTSAVEVSVKTVPHIEKRTSYNPTQISDIQKSNPDIAELFQMMQGIMINPNHVMQNVLIWIYEYLGLKVEVIMTIITYCKDIDRINANYIEKIAINWAENEIDTLDRANAEVDRLMETRTFTGRIMKMFEMKRKPTTSQQEFIDEWRRVGYSMELIKYAYEITVENTGNLSFPYINKILLNWNENGIKTIDEAKNASSEHKKNHKPKSDNSDGFDADKYDIVVNNF